MREGGAEVEALRQQAQDLGIVLSEDTLKAAEEFEDSWRQTKLQLQAVGNAILQELLPVFVNDLLPVIQESVIPALKSTAEFVADAIKWFKDLSPEVKTAAGVFAAALGAAGPVMTALGLVSKAISLMLLATGPIGLLILAVGTTAVLAFKIGTRLPRSSPASSVRSTR